MGVAEREIAGVREGFLEKNIQVATSALEDGNPVSVGSTPFENRAIDGWRVSAMLQ